MGWSRGSRQRTFPIPGPLLSIRFETHGWTYEIWRMDHGHRFDAGDRVVSHGGFGYRSLERSRLQPCPPHYCGCPFAPPRRAQPQGLFQLPPDHQSPKGFGDPLRSGHCQWNHVTAQRWTRTPSLLQMPPYPCPTRDPCHAGNHPRERSIGQAPGSTHRHDRSRFTAHSPGDTTKFRMA